MSGVPKGHKLHQKAGKKKASERQGANLGKMLIRHQFPSINPGLLANEDEAIETERGKHKLRSVTQCDDLEELMSQAALAGTDFTAKRGEMVIVGQEARMELERVRAPEQVVVSVPRRPPWRSTPCLGRPCPRLSWCMRAWLRKPPSPASTPTTSRPP